MLKMLSIHDKKEEAFLLADGVFGFFGFLGFDIRSELSSVDWALSRGIEVDGKLSAIYLLSVKNEPLGLLSGDCLCGEALLVAPECRGRGLSEMLFDYAYSLGFDYIWGYQHKRLNNLPFWLKTRELIGEQDDCYITARKLK